MIFAEARARGRHDVGDAFAELHAAVELDAVTLAVVETEGFDMVEAVKRPGEARGRILAARKQHERAAARALWRGRLHYELPMTNASSPER
ncbi:protein of unknown function [Pararobbsia alpina]